MLAEELEALSAVERMGLLGHQWAIVRTGRAKIDAFLDLAMSFRGERDPDVLIALNTSLFPSRDKRVVYAVPGLLFPSVVAPRITFSAPWLERLCRQLGKVDEATTR